MITVGESGIGIIAQGSNSTVVNSGTITAGENGTGIQIGRREHRRQFRHDHCRRFGGTGIIGGNDTTVVNGGRSRSAPTASAS